MPEELLSQMCASLAAGQSFAALEASHNQVVREVHARAAAKYYAACAAWQEELRAAAEGGIGKFARRGIRV